MSIVCWSACADDGLARADALVSGMDRYMEVVERVRKASMDHPDLFDPRQAQARATARHNEYYRSYRP
jgi:hypothetical protein